MNPSTVIPSIAAATGTSRHVSRPAAARMVGASRTLRASATTASSRSGMPSASAWARAAPSIPAPVARSAVWRTAWTARPSAVAPRPAPPRGSVALRLDLDRRAVGRTTVGRPAAPSVRGGVVRRRMPLVDAAGGRSASAIAVAATTGAEPVRRSPRAAPATTASRRDASIPATSGSSSQRSCTATRRAPVRADRRPRPATAARAPRSTRSMSAAWHFVPSWWWRLTTRWSRARVVAT